MFLYTSFGAATPLSQYEKSTPSPSPLGERIPNHLKPASYRCQPARFAAGGPTCLQSHSVPSLNCNQPDPV